MATEDYKPVSGTAPLPRKTQAVEPYHTYDTLPPGWIRILKLTYGSRALPDTRTKPVHISMISVPLASQPSYVALSYTWGAPTWNIYERAQIFTQEPRCYPIHCAGKLLLGTETLRAALNGIRYAQQTQRSYPQNLPKGSDKVGGGIFNEGCYLWIDALCIDQDDLQERAQQVAQMGTIYAKAKSCLAWLGEADGPARTACQFSMRIAQNPNVRTYGSNLMESPLSRYRLREEIMHELHALDDGQAADMAIFFSRRYFSRLWIVQEAVLAPDLFVMCGELSMDFEALLITAQVFQACMTLTFWSRAYLDAKEKDGSLPLIGSDGSCSETFTLLTAIARCRSELASGRKSSFMDALQMTSKTQATDPRDRIYGILAITRDLFRDSQPIIVVDYTSPVEEVYIRTTVAIVVATKSLETLYKITPQFRPLDSVLPSWCPDYTVTNRPLLVGPGGSNYGWQTGGVWPREPGIQFKGHTMLADGFKYDEIRATAPIKDSGSSHLFSLLVNLKWKPPPFSRDRSPTRVDMLWRLLNFDQTQQHRASVLATKLLLPATCAALMISHLSVSESFSADTASIDLNEEAIRMEYEAFRDKVCHLLELEPDSAPFLPQNVFDTKPLTCGKDIIDWFDGEISGIEARAKRAGLDTELKELIPALPGASRYNELMSATQEFAHSFIMEMLMSSKLIETCIFSTERSERLGMGPKSLQAGDEIWYLNGAAGPCILRPRESGSYQFISMIYIEGLMHGEIAEEPDNNRGSATKVSIS